MSENIMFDFAGYYERIARQMPDDCRLAEIGVADAKSVLFLADSLHHLGKRFTIYAIDNLDYGGLTQLCTIYENLIISQLGRYIKVIPYDSVKASEQFNDGFLDFIFLDASHQYQETKDSIKAWYPKLKDGGIFAGHDFQLYPEVAAAVTELIPFEFTREQINDDPFEPEQFLHIENTDRDYGLWWAQKDFYKFLNT